MVDRAAAVDAQAKTVQGGAHKHLADRVLFVKVKSRPCLDRTILEQQGCARRSAALFQLPDAAITTAGWLAFRNAAPHLPVLV